MADPKSEATLARIEAELRCIRGLLEDHGVERLAVNFTEAGRMLSRSAKTVSRMVKAGELRTVLIHCEKMVSVMELRRITTPKTPQRRSGGPKPRETYSLAADLAKAEALLRARRKRD